MRSLRPRMRLCDSRHAQYMPARGRTCRGFVRSVSPRISALGCFWLKFSTGERNNCITPNHSRVSYSERNVRKNFGAAVSPSVLLVR